MPTQSELFGFRSCCMQYWFPAGFGIGKQGRCWQNVHPAATQVLSPRAAWATWYDGRYQREGEKRVSGRPASAKGLVGFNEWECLCAIEN